MLYGTSEKYFLNDKIISTIKNLKHIMNLKMLSVLENCKY